MSDTTSVSDFLKLGREAHSRGDLEGARASYASLLEKDPKNPDVHHFLAGIEMELGNLQQAEHYVREALKLNRYGVGYQNTLGDVLVATGRYREAEAAYFEELRMRPEFAVSHNQLGNLMMRSGDLRRAIKHYQSALEFAPHFAVASINLGRAFQKGNQLEEAYAAFLQASRLDPESVDAEAHLGLIEVFRGKLSQASHHLDKVLKLDPDNATAGVGLGEWFLKQGRITESIEVYQRVVANHPKELDAITGLAEVWRRQGLLEQAEDCMLKAVKLAPGKVELFNNLATIQINRGRHAQALESFERALQLKPSDQYALTGYGHLKARTGDSQMALTRLGAVVHSGLAGTELLGAYAKLLGSMERGREGISMLEQRLRTKIPVEEGIRLRYTLAELLDADSSYDLAYYYFREANQMDKAKFDRQRFADVCSGIASAFAPDKVRSRCPEERLVFMIGMPRSGLGVMQDILGKEESVYLSGSSTALELSAYRMSGESGGQWPAAAAGFDQDLLDRYAKEYLDRLPQDLDQDAIIIDSTWRNFLYVGLIEQLFPKARLVYCARDYRDTSLSCFFTDFGAQPRYSFTHNLMDLAAFAREHKNLMRHWSETSSLPMHVVSYEALILDFEDEIGSLRGFLGLGNNVQQEEEKEAEKLPKPSYLKSTSLRRYRHYKNHLEPFLEEFGTPPDVAY